MARVDIFKIGGNCPVLYNAIIMGDHSHHVIAVYLMCPRGIPVCYNKILDVSIVTESKKQWFQLQECFIFTRKRNKQKAEKAQEKREIKLPQNHPSTERY